MSRIGRLYATPLFGPEGKSVVYNAMQVFGPFRIGPLKDLYELDQNGDGTFGRFTGWYEQSNIDNYINVREHRKLWDLFRRITCVLKNRKQGDSLQDQDILENVILRVILKEGHTATECLREWEPDEMPAYDSVWGFEWYLVCHNSAGPGHTGLRAYFNEVWRDIHAENNREIGNPIMINGSKGGAQATGGDSEQAAGRRRGNDAGSIARYKTAVELANSHSVLPPDSAFNMTQESADWSKTLVDHAHLRDCLRQTINNPNFEPTITHVINTSTTNEAGEADDMETGGADQSAVDLQLIMDIAPGSWARPRWEECPVGANPGQFGDEGFIQTEIGANALPTGNVIFGSLAEGHARGYMTYSIEPHRLMGDAINSTNFLPLFSTAAGRRKDCVVPSFTILAADADGNNRVSIFESLFNHMQRGGEDIALPEPADRRLIVKLFSEHQQQWVINDPRFIPGSTESWSYLPEFADPKPPHGEIWDERMHFDAGTSLYKLVRIIDKSVVHPFRGEEIKCRMESYETALAETVFGGPVPGSEEQMVLAYTKMSDAKPCHMARLVDTVTPRGRVMFYEPKAEARTRHIKKLLNSHFAIAWDKNQPMANSIKAVIVEFGNRQRANYGDSMEFPCNSKNKEDRGWKFEDENLTGPQCFYRTQIDLMESLQGVYYHHHAVMKMRLVFRCTQKGEDRQPHMMAVGAPSSGKSWCAANELRSVPKAMILPAAHISAQRNYAAAACKDSLASGLIYYFDEANAQKLGMTYGGPGAPKVHEVAEPAVEFKQELSDRHLVSVVLTMVNGERKQTWYEVNNENVKYMNMNNDPGKMSAGMRSRFTFSFFPKEIHRADKKLLGIDIGKSSSQSNAEAQLEKTYQMLYYRQMQLEMAQYCGILMGPHMYAWETFAVRFMEFLKRDTVADTNFIQRRMQDATQLMKRYVNFYAVFMVFAHESSPFKDRHTFTYDMLLECEKYMVVGERMNDIIISMIEDDLFNPHQRDLLLGIQKQYLKMLPAPVEQWQYVDITAADGVMPDGVTDNHPDFVRPTDANGNLKPEHSTRYPWRSKKACLPTDMDGLRPYTKPEFLANRGPTEGPKETAESKRRTELAMRYVVVCTKTCSDTHSLLKEVANSVIGVFRTSPDMSVEAPCQEHLIGVLQEMMETPTIDPMDPQKVTHPAVEVIVTSQASRGQQEMALCISKTLLDQVFVGHDSVKYVLQNSMYKYSPPGTRILAKPMRHRVGGKIQLTPQLCDFYEVPLHAAGCAALRHPRYEATKKAREQFWEAKGFNFVACTECTKDPGCNCFRSEDRIQIIGSHTTQSSRDEWMRRAKISIEPPATKTEGVVKGDTPDEDIAFVEYFRDVLGYTLMDVTNKQNGLMWSYHPRYNAAKIVRGSQIPYPSGVAHKWLRHQTQTSKHHKELGENPDAVTGQMDSLVPEELTAGGGRVSGRTRINTTVSARERPGDMPQGRISQPVASSDLLLASEELNEAIDDWQDARKKRPRMMMAQDAGT